MDFLGILIAMIVVSLLVAILACRIARRRGQKQGWYVVAITTIVTTVAVVVFGYLGVLSVPGDVAKTGGFRYWTRIAPILFLFSTVIAAFVSAGVVDFYRGKRS